MNSPFGKLNLHDLLKGIGMTIGSAIVTGLYTLGQANAPIDGSAIKTVALSGISAGIAYLLKNFFTNSAGSFASLEPKH